MEKKNKFATRIEKGIDTLADAMREGQEKTRILTLTGDDIAVVLDSDNDEIDNMLQDQQINFADHFVRVRTPRGESESYMKSADELKAWLRRTILN